MVWPGDGKGVTWVGENLARERVVKREDLSDVSSEMGDWGDLAWSGSEDEESMMQEAKLRRDMEDDFYTQTDRLFAESSGDASSRETTEIKQEIGEDLDAGRVQETNRAKGKAPGTLSSPSSPPTAPSRRAMPWTPKPAPKGGYVLEAAQSRPPPQGNPFRPGPSTPRTTRQKSTDDSEIMQYLVGSMANLAIPMSQDDGGRWRIDKRL